MKDLSVLQNWLKEEVKTTTYEELANRVGMHWQSIRKIVSGENDNPRYKSLALIEKAMEEAETKGL